MHNNTYQCILPALNIFFSPFLLNKFLITALFNFSIQYEEEGGALKPLSITDKSGNSRLLEDVQQQNLNDM